MPVASAQCGNDLSDHIVARVIFGYTADSSHRVSFMYSGKLHGGRKVAVVIPCFRVRKHISSRLSIAIGPEVAFASTSWMIAARRGRAEFVKRACG